mmetsp:Transcript_119/g.295  ORF Transcript_119/g.295 Transcript_119/m.295 type:complete len:116 (-) Transcript_119:2384-2731(-)
MHSRVIYKLKLFQKHEGNGFFSDIWLHSGQARDERRNKAAWTNNRQQYSHDADSFSGIASGREFCFNERFMYKRLKILDRLLPKETEPGRHAVRPWTQTHLDDSRLWRMRSRHVT